MSSPKLRYSVDVNSGMALNCKGYIDFCLDGEIVGRLTQRAFKCWLCGDYDHWDVGTLRRVMESTHHNWKPGPEDSEAK